MTLQEESLQMPQISINLPELPAGTVLLLPVVGLPVALHALAGAAVGLITFTVGSLFVGMTQEKTPNMTALPSSRREVEEGTTA
ncbi:MAG: hypothetical protein WCI64_02770 [Chlorobium sp.]